MSIINNLKVNLEHLKEKLSLKNKKTEGLRFLPNFTLSPDLYLPSLKTMGTDFFVNAGKLEGLDFGTISNPIGNMKQNLNLENLDSGDLESLKLPELDEDLKPKLQPPDASQIKSQIYDNFENLEPGVLESLKLPELDEDLKPKLQPLDASQIKSQIYDNFENLEPGVLESLKLPDLNSDNEVKRSK